jgi:hypothetical protein
MMENYGKTSENTEAEVELNSDVNKENYAVAIKCIFNDPKNSIKGAFCFLLRKHDSKMIELVLWTTKSIPKEEINLLPSMPWEDFSTKTPTIGPIDNVSFEKLQTALKEKFTSEMIKNIFKDYESDLIPFKDDIKETIEGKLHYFINLDLEFEPFSQERLIKSGYERVEASPAKSSENVTMIQIMAEQMNNQQLNCTAIVDPINGIAAMELETGDLVEVVIPTNNPTGVLLSDYYTKLKKTPMFPVKNVSMSDNGSCTVSLEADVGLTCVVKIAGNLKIRGKRVHTYKKSVSKRSLIIIGFSSTIFILILIALIKLLMR